MMPCAPYDRTRRTYPYAYWVGAEVEAGGERFEPGHFFLFGRRAGAHAQVLHGNCQVMVRRAALEEIDPAAAPPAPVPASPAGVDPAARLAAYFGSPVA
jgi:hypothetical protein